MKRVGYLYEKVYDLDNLRLADVAATKGKRKQWEVIEYWRNREENIQRLHESLKNMTYKTSEYSTFNVYEPKLREISKLPFYVDRICHHALLNIIEPILTRSFTVNTYSCIVDRGIHRLYYDLKEALSDTGNTQYALKVDIKKYFQNVSHDVLKGLLRRKFKDEKLLWLLDEIIQSHPGLPIGSYTSGILSNFYLNWFDHWLKEEKGVKYTFRYCDDILVLDADKKFLHNLREDMQLYLWQHLKLEVKNNYRVFNVAKEGIDIVGYKLYPDYSLLRKSIKESFKKMIRENRNEHSIGAYGGWISHCNGVNLSRKYGIFNN